MNRCENPVIADTLGSYVLGACPSEEAHTVSAHVADCAACQRDVRELTLGREALLTAMPVMTAPESLRQSLMAQVRADADLFEAAQARVPEPVTSRFRALLDNLRMPRVCVPAGVLACVAVACVAVGVWGVASHSDGPGTPNRVIAGQVDPSLPRGAEAALAVDDGQATLTVRGLPPAGPGRRYQVWLRTNGEVRPTQVLFDVDVSGAGSAPMRPLAAGTQLLVTSEPAVGSQRPSRSPVLTVDA